MSWLHNYQVSPCSPSLLYEWHKPPGGLSAPWQAGGCAIQSERYKLQGKNLAAPI